MVMTTMAIAFTLKRRCGYVRDEIAPHPALLAAERPRREVEEEGGLCMGVASLHCRVDPQKRQIQIWMFPFDFLSEGSAVVAQAGYVVHIQLK